MANSNPMTVNVEHSNIQLTTTFLVKGLSTMVSKTYRTRLQKDFDGAWAIQLDFPRSAGKDKGDKGDNPYLMVSVCPTAPLPTRYGDLKTLTVSLSLETLGSIVHKTHSFELNPSKDISTDEERWFRFITLSALWTDNPEIKRDDGFRMVVNITSVPAPARPVIAAPLMLNNILQLIEGHDIIDTKFLLFSKRYETDGRIGASHPLPVYANSALLRSQCAYFDAMLGGGSDFSESQMVDLDRAPTTLSIDQYDYESDSDLGYFSGEEEGEDEGTTAVGPMDESKITRPSTPSSTSSLSDDQDDIERASDSDKESDGGELWLDTLKYRKHARYRNHFGKMAVVQDAAYVTWKALIFYLCTSQISFAPLSSQGASRSRSPSERSQGLPSRPSAKSIYRLADKLGLSDLTELALDHIRSQLSKDLIIRELFCRFTSQHGIVRDMELAFVFEHWEELKSSKEVLDTINQVATGAMPHAAEILACLVSH